MRISQPVPVPTHIEAKGDGAPNPLEIDSDPFGGDLFGRLF